MIVLAENEKSSPRGEDFFCLLQFYFLGGLRSVLCFYDDDEHLVLDVLQLEIVVTDGQQLVGVRHHSCLVGVDGLAGIAHDVEPLDFLLALDAQVLALFVFPYLVADGKLAGRRVHV